MQAKAIMKKDSTVKIRYSGIKFLYISSSASHKPFLCEQRIRKRKLFIPTHTKLVSASHSEHNSSFHIKAKSNIFFYNSTDIMSIGGRRRRKEEQKKKWNQQVVCFFFFSPTQHFTVLWSFQPRRIFSSLPAFPFMIPLPSLTSLKSTILLAQEQVNSDILVVTWFKLVQNSLWHHASHILLC